MHTYTYIQAYIHRYIHTYIHTYMHRSKIGWLIQLIQGKETKMMSSSVPNSKYQYKSLVTWNQRCIEWPAYPIVNPSGIKVVWALNFDAWKAFKCWFEGVWYLDAYIHTYIHIHKYTYIYTYVHIYIYTYKKLCISASLPILIPWGQHFVKSVLSSKNI